MLCVLYIVEFVTHGFRAILHLPKSKRECRPNEMPDGLRTTHDLAVVDLSQETTGLLPQTSPKAHVDFTDQLSCPTIHKRKTKRVLSNPPIEANSPFILYPL